MEKDKLELAMEETKRQLTAKEREISLLKEQCSNQDTLVR